MNELNYNNDTEGIVEFPLTPEEIGVLRDIYSKFVVELGAQDVSRPEALSAIIKVAQKVSPHWVLKNFINNDEFKVVKDGEMIRFVFDENKDFTNKMTSGEEKVAKSILDHFKQGFKVRNPSRITFESCLETAFPKIKNGKTTTTNLINKGWLKEVDGKIFIGEEGEKYLSP